MDISYIQEYNGNLNATFNRRSFLREAKKKMDGAVLTLVITKLSDLLEQKVRLIAGAEEEIRSLRDELNLLTIFLDGINDQSDRTTALVQELMHQLQRVSFDAEDVVDQYLLDVARHERKFVKVFSGCGKLSRKGKLAARAKDIKLTIDGILRNKEKYGVRLDYGAPSDRAAQQNGENELNRWRRNVEEEDVVGFDQQICQVMEMLVPRGGGVEDEGLRVVSIIGMGGLGKSTLVRKIFNHEEIKSKFETRVWVVVSEHVEAKYVLKNILQFLKVNTENDDKDKDDDDYLKEILKEQLGGRKYLIVLDDLWTPKQWEELKSYLPSDHKRGSRILLTSRIENVANVASTDSTTYHLNPLGDADSWSLFCKKALKGEKCPLNLEATGKGIVSKCKGLPLAIIVLGSLLSAAEAKPSFKYWSKILGDTSWHPDFDNDCSKILSLSYRNLPPHLKACFLYVGVFPEDFEISAGELCLLWVAEGFVKGRSTESEEDVAQEYLINLVDRNLIMISKRKSDGSIKSCRIHDLFRDLCMKEAERCNLYKVHMDGASQNFKEGIRRLVLHKSDSRSKTLLPPPLYEGIKTLFDHSRNEFSNMCSVFEDLCTMRVLHLLCSNGSGRLKLAKNMILLRYLKIVQYQLLANKLVIRTQDISNLSNLQVLKLMNSVTTHLPKGIWKLKLLRHVHVREMCAMPDAPSSNDSLPHLQTLSCVKYEEHTAKMLSSERFPNLRKLFMEVGHNDQCNNLWRTESLKSLPELLHLASLKIRCHCFPLDRLRPFNVYAFPSTLTKIHVNKLAVKSDHWKLFGKLKNLQVLKLCTWGTDTNRKKENFVDQPLVFEAEAFPQLLHLKLWTNHPDLIIEDGALRSLQYLIIRSPNILTCCGISALPDQLWRSTTLRQVKVIYPSSYMLKYVRSLDDSKRSKVIICRNYFNSKPVVRCI